MKQTLKHLLTPSIIVGLSSLAIFLGGCQTTTQEDTVQLTTTVETTAYQQQFRPQFHFSPDSMWMNDPNGMVYYQGEYHLFYQYFPDSTVWGPMHWGHAVTKDLIHWQHLPIALYPDSLGYIFSGSAVVDWQNTSGFGSEQSPPLVAIYTYHDVQGERSGKIDYQTQGIAYSLDLGRTWEKYQHNPVLKNPGIKDFRDPKVFWYQPGDYWVMILAVDDHVRLYQSKDLKSWKLLSEFGKTDGSHGGVWECPDLFPLMDPQSGEEKWIMLVSLGDGGPNGGSGTQYFIGDFDGKTFHNDNSPEVTLWLDFGRDNYAGVTWSDIPDNDGRRIFLGWMSNWKYAQQVPTKRWRSAMTLPRELRLDHTPEGLRLLSFPVKETTILNGGSLEIGNQSLSTGQTLGLDTGFDKSLCLLELSLTPDQEAAFVIEFGNSEGQKVQFAYDTDGSSFSFDRTASGNTEFSPEFGGVHFAPRLSNKSTLNLQIYLDHSSLEIFADQGQVTFTELMFPTPPYDQITLYSTKGTTEIEGGKITQLHSIW